MSCYDTFETIWDDQITIFFRNLIFYGFRSSGEANEVHSGVGWKLKLLLT